MVVLPKNLKYKQEIFGAIIDVFSEIKDGEIYYREIWRKVNKALIRQISFRDFQAHISYMESEKILKRRDLGGRGPKVYFSLTDKAKRLNSFKILGINESTKNRKRVCQLLLFFKLFKRRNPVTQRQLYRFLEQIGASKEVLKVVKATDKITHFEPVKGVEIIKWIQSNSRIDHNTSVYYITIPGFTLDEFASYLKKLKKGKEPQPFPDYLGITNVPFIPGLNVSKSEIADVIELLRNDGLIESIGSIFLGEMRYDITDKSVIKFLNDIWMVHDIDLRLLFERIVYCGEPKSEDIGALRLMYGERTADRILALGYNKRKMNNKQNYKEEEKTAREFIKTLVEYRTSLVQDILMTHEKIIEKYEIISELIDGICSPTFLSNKK